MINCMNRVHTINQVRHIPHIPFPPLEAAIPAIHLANTLLEFERVLLLFFRESKS